jgi:hypothetical protein
MHLLTYASYCSHLHIGWHGACLVTEFAPTVRATSGQGGTPDGREQTANDRGAGRRPAAQSGRVWGCVVFTIVIYCVYYSVQWPSMYSSGTPLTRSTEFGVRREDKRALPLLVWFPGADRRGGSVCLYLPLARPLLGEIEYRQEAR